MYAAMETHSEFCQRQESFAYNSFTGELRVCETDFVCMAPSERAASRRASGFLLVCFVFVFLSHAVETRRSPAIRERIKKVNWHETRRYSYSVLILCTVGSVQFSPLIPQWGAADAKIKVPSGENTELKRSPFKSCLLYTSDAADE